MPESEPQTSFPARASGRFLAAFTDDLVELELGPPTGDIAARTREWVVARVAAAGTLTRLTLELAGLVLGAWVRIRTGSGYATLPPERRRQLARRLAASNLPVASEYVRVVRALAVSYVFEARFATAE